MQSLLAIGQWILANYQLVIAAVNAVIVALIALFLIIPGPQPEAFLKSVADFLAKFSKK